MHIVSCGKPEFWGAFWNAKTLSFLLVENLRSSCDNKNTVGEANLRQQWHQCKFFYIVSFHFSVLARCQRCFDFASARVRGEKRRKDRRKGNSVAKEKEFS